MTKKKLRTLRDRILGLSQNNLHPDLEVVIKSNNGSDAYKSMENALNECEPYLDKNFLSQFIKEEQYYSRLWEL